MARKTFNAPNRVNSRRKKKAPKDAAMAVGARGGTTETRAGERKDRVEKKVTLRGRKIFQLCPFLFIDT